MITAPEPARVDGDATAAAALVTQALVLCGKAHLDLPAMLLRDALDCLTED